MRQSVMWGPSPFLKGRCSNLQNKTPCPSAWGKVPLPEAILSSLLLLTFLSHPPFYKNLPFYTTPWSCPLVARWDAAQFMDQFISQLDLQIYVVEFCFSTVLWEDNFEACSSLGPLRNWAPGAYSSNLIINALLISSSSFPDSLLPPTHFCFLGYPPK